MRPLLTALLSMATLAVPATASERPAVPHARLTDLLPSAGVGSLQGDPGPLAEPGDLLPRAAHPAITSSLDAERALLERAWGTAVFDLRSAMHRAESGPAADPRSPTPGSGSPSPRAT